MIALNLKTENTKYIESTKTSLKQCPLPVCSPGYIRYCKAVAQVTGNTSEHKQGKRERF